MERKGEKTRKERKKLKEGLKRKARGREEKESEKE